MDRQLINYLPYVIRDYDVYKALMAAEQPEFEFAWDSVNGALNEQFLSTAGEIGISRWEKMLHILPKLTDTLDDRRFRILTKINASLPYTMRNLDVSLKTLCGEDNYTVTLEDYTLTVVIARAAKENFTDVQNMLNNIVPANIQINLIQMYNPYSELAEFTHVQLHAYTHYQLRNEVFTNGD